jgi:hypothetical protein
MTEVYTLWILDCDRDCLVGIYTCRDNADQAEQLWLKRHPWADLEVRSVYLDSVPDLLCDDSELRASPIRIF